MTGLCDSHLHIGSLERLDDLLGYIRLLRPVGLGLLSLPVVGTGAEGDEIVDFNPELLAAGAAVSHLDESPAALHLYGCLDNRGLLVEESNGGARSTGAPAAPWNPEEQVRALADAGFTGLKLWEGKPDLHAALGISLDDARLVAACRLAGELSMPAILHVADPREFWATAGGPWSYVGKDVASFNTLQAEAEALVAAAPGTTFIFAHLGFLADDLTAASNLLSRHSNLHFDLAPGNYFYPALARAADRYTPADSASYEAGREFFAAYSDRLLAGSDGFFLPQDLGSLAGTSLANNLERMLRLVQFLNSPRPIASPYGLRGSPPMALGLDLAEDVCDRIFCTNFEMLPHRKKSATGDGPGRTGVDAEAAVAWLDTWGRDADGRRAPVRQARAEAARRVIEEAAG